MTATEYDEYADGTTARVFVEPTWYDMAAVMRRAMRIMRRHEHSVRQYGYDRDNWPDQVAGLLAEQSAAKHYVCPWEEKPFERRHEPDVGDDDRGFDVRATEHVGGQLILHPSDPDDRLVVFCTVERPRVEIVGGITGAEGKRVGVEREYRNKGACLFVPREYLHPVVL